jgi:hypothetical protein
MRVTVLSSTRVLLEPPLIARVLYKRTSELVELRDIGWFFTPGSRWVGREAEAEIVSALERERRAVRSSTAPPS